MTYNELFTLLSKPWANVSDIKKIASCGRDSATLLRDNIIKDIIKNGQHLPTSRTKIVPMESIIKYLNLDIEHISLMAQKEQKLKS